ncbi:MAG: serpin family protein [Planctomycetota bacterium]
MKSSFFITLLFFVLPLNAQELQTLANGNNMFAIQLYQKLAAANKTNLFFSPYSISTAFAMTYAGARGETARQIAQVLCFPADESIHASFARLEEHLEKNTLPEKLSLSVANALWPAEKLPLLPAFLDLTKKYYGAAVFPLDFGNAQSACDKINHWVEEKTQNKIKDLVSPDVVNSATELVLTNAIYFKGNWKYSFDPKDTGPAPFWITADKSVEVSMMHLKNTKIRFMENETLQMIELPYQGESISMKILLPRDKKSWSAFEQSVRSENLNLWQQELHLQKIPVALPKFKMTLRFNLADTLEQMGIVDAFHGGKADFSGMDGAHSLFISAVIHQAFVEVNEEGTEAAAATAITMEKSGPPKRFYADHPFIFLIQDQKTGNILFLGRVMNPSF